MARRDRSGTEPDKTEGEGTVTTATDETAVPAQVDAVDTSAAEGANTEAPAAAADGSGKAAKASEVDLTAFSAAVEKSVAERDSSTGELAVAQIDPVVSEYRKIEGIAGKNKAKNFLTDKMRDAMNSMNIVLARSYMILADNLSAGTVPKAERAPSDPTEAHIQRVVGLDLARALLVKPEGVTEDADAKAEALYAESYPKAEAYLAWASNEDEATKGDEPEVPAFVRNAVKLALGKSAKVGGSRTGTATGGERHDIGEHIRQSFEGQESGTFLTIAEIRNYKSTEYGDTPPSAGAISARLFPQSGKCTLGFVTPGQNDKGNRGATKV